MSYVCTLVTNLKLKSAIAKTAIIFRAKDVLKEI